MQQRSCIHSKSGAWLPVKCSARRYSLASISDCARGVTLFHDDCNRQRTPPRKRRSDELPVRPSAPHPSARSPSLPPLPFAESSTRRPCLTTTSIHSSFQGPKQKCSTFSDRKRRKGRGKAWRPQASRQCQRCPRERFLNLRDRPLAFRNPRPRLLPL